MREMIDSREGWSVEEELFYNEYVDATDRRLEMYEDFGPEYDDDDYGYADDYDDSMDGDFDSGMASAGFGTDEDYGYYGEDEYVWDCDFGPEG